MEPHRPCALGQGVGQHVGWKQSLDAAFKRRGPTQERANRILLAVPQNPTVYERLYQYYFDLQLRVC